MIEPDGNKKGKHMGPRIDGGTPGARQWAAAILQVLAGEWTPSEGAAAVGVTLPHYYAVESRAMTGLVAACERNSRRRLRQSGKEVSDLKKQVERLQRECGRKQALLRASQRTLGIQMSAPKTKPKRKRRPAVRALKMVEALSKPESTEQKEEEVLS